MYYINKNNKISKNISKELVISIIGMIILAGLLLVNAKLEREKQVSAVSYQQQIAGEVLRFHVIANSDSEEDQKLKLKVKEAVLEAMRPKLADAKTVEEAEEIIMINMEEIEAVADKVIKEEGYTYKSRGVLGKTTFPVKQYGDMVFPAGEYEAFRILLGEAEGKNWWCVMFPTLCYVDETYDVITEENKEQFKAILTEEEYESLLISSNLENNTEDNKRENKNQITEEVRVFYKLKSLVWLNKVIDYFWK